MSKIQILTTQNVALDFTPASVGDRILAHLIDWVLFIAWSIIFVFLAIAIEEAMNESKIIMFFFFTGLMLPLLCYDLLLEVFMNGQSIGKKVMNIRVIALDGTQPTLGAYLMRWLFRLADTVIFGSVVALIVTAINGKGQRIGDIAAGTVVVKLKQNISIEQLRQESLEENYQVVFKEVTILSDHDITTLQAVLNKGENNYELTAEAAKKVKKVINVASELDDIQFLKQIVKDYTYLMTIED
jgi:uncharacterized RDD family membrane protein YckC